MAAVPLMTAREPYDDAEVAGVEAPTEPDAPADEAPMAAPSPKRKPSAVASDTALVEPTAETDAAWPPVEARADHSAPAETALEGPRAAPVTITGCLELDGRTFRLKDTSGEDAPRSRSWRSGFLRKRAASIELVDDTNALKLPDYVGQRVAATGVLVNREMQARSLRRVASSCH